MIRNASYLLQPNTLTSAMRRAVLLLGLLLLLGLTTSIALAWAAATLDRTKWPDVPPTWGTRGVAVVRDGWRIEQTRDATVSWRHFQWHRLNNPTPDAGAEVALPNWSVWHDLPPQPGPFTPERERAAMPAWDFEAGWPLRCLRGGHHAPMEASPPERAWRRAAPASAWEWPWPHNAIDEALQPANWTWPKVHEQAVLPLMPLWAGLAGNTLVFAAFWAVLLSPSVLPGLSRRRWRRRHGRCAWCGHSTRGLPEGAVCPECGTPPGRRRTPLTVMTGRGPFVAALLSLPLVIAATATLALAHWEPVERWTPLQHAAASGNADELRRLLGEGGGHDPQSALGMAIMNGHDEARELLIQAGADPTGYEFAAATAGDVELFERVLAMTPPGPADDDTAWSICFIGDPYRELLLAHFTFTPLQLGRIAEYDLEFLEIERFDRMLERGVGPTNPHAERVMSVALQQDRLAWAEPFHHDLGLTAHLLEKGFDPHPVQHWPLAYAVGCDPAFEALLAAGADPTLPVGPRGRTLMQYAMGGGVEWMRRVADLGAPIDQPDTDGWTPLWSAAIAGRPELVRWLLDAGADPSYTAGGRSLRDVLTDVMADPGKSMAAWFLRGWRVWRDDDDARLEALELIEEAAS